MSIVVKPAEALFTCDLCGMTRAEPTILRNGINAAPERPSRWSRLYLQRDAEDWQGQAVASANVSRVFCPNCTSTVAKALNALKPS